MKFQVESKESIAEAVYIYDALQNRKPFLDQLMEGLEEFQLGKACHLFPRVFQPLFVSEKCKPEDVLQILYTESTMGDRQQVLYEYLRQFLMECDHDGEHHYELKNILYKYIFQLSVLSSVCIASGLPHVHDR